MAKVLTLSAEEAYFAAEKGLQEEADYVWYEQVPLGPGDVVWGDEKRGWIDRRTTDGSMLAMDGRNAKNG